MLPVKAAVAAASGDDGAACCCPLVGSRDDSGDDEAPELPPASAPNTRRNVCAICVASACFRYTMRMLPGAAVARSSSCTSVRTRDKRPPSSLRMITELLRKSAVINSRSRESAVAAGSANTRLSVDTTSSALAWFNGISSGAGALGVSSRAITA